MPVSISFLNHSLRTLLHCPSPNTILTQAGPRGWTNPPLTRTLHHHGSQRLRRGLSSLLTPASVPVARAIGASRNPITSDTRTVARDLYFSSSVRVRPHSTKPSYRPQAQTIEYHQTAFGGWSTIVACGIAGGFYFLYSYSQIPEEVRRHSSEVVDTIYNEEDKEESDNGFWSKMTGETLPGRPGTLTPDQEEKLRELWVATFQVFGVISPEEANGKMPVDIPKHNGAVTAEKSKKKKGFFGRKTQADTEADGDEDKFGQTKQFHDALANQSPEQLKATMWSMVKHDNPDALLLRFLRARKWNVEKALIMMISTMSWRGTEMHVDDDIMKNGELHALLASQSGTAAEKKLGEDLLAQLRMGKSFLHGTDKEGRPICTVRVRLHKQGEQSEESLERYTVFIIETARLMLSPPVDTACVVFDMTGFSMANMDYSPVKFMIKCFEANYPESLGVVLVHKAPWIFQGVWKIIKGWLDPVVASKVHFTNNVDEMSEYISKDHITKELGGDEDWTWKYLEPVPGENDKIADTATTQKLWAERNRLVQKYEDATLEWIKHSNATNATDIKKKRFDIAEELKADYWKMDSHLRAKTHYDRVGLIQEGGKLQFYPGETKETVVPTNSTPIQQTSADDVD